jgi:hypothetical protein
MPPPVSPRQNKLCAQVWDTYGDILEACKTAWNWLIADPDRQCLSGLVEQQNRRPHPARSAVPVKGRQLNGCCCLPRPGSAATPHQG